MRNMLLNDKAWHEFVVTFHKKLQFIETKYGLIPKLTADIIGATLTDRCIEVRDILDKEVFLNNPESDIEAIYNFVYSPNGTHKTNSWFCMFNDIHIFGKTYRDHGQYHIN